MCFPLIVSHSYQNNVIILIILHKMNVYELKHNNYNQNVKILFCSDIYVLFCVYN